MRLWLEFMRSSRLAKMSSRTSFILLSFWLEADFSWRLSSMFFITSERSLLLFRRTRWIFFLRKSKVGASSGSLTPAGWPGASPSCGGCLGVPSVDGAAEAFPSLSEGRFRYCLQLPDPEEDPESDPMKCMSADSLPRKTLNREARLLHFNFIEEGRSYA